jgi:hypothetical protein
VSRAAVESAAAAPALSRLQCESREDGDRCCRGAEVELNASPGSDEQFVMCAMHAAEAVARGSEVVT